MEKRDEMTLLEELLVEHFRVRKLIIAFDRSKRLVRRVVTVQFDSDALAA